MYELEEDIGDYYNKDYVTIPWQTNLNENHKCDTQTA